MSSPLLRGPDELPIDRRQRWRGERLHGKPLLVWLAGGYGDVIMYASFIPPCLAVLDGPVTFVTYQQLAPLFQQSFPAADIRTHMPLPPARYSATGAVLGWGMGQTPRRVPYLRAASPYHFAPAAIHVGICWRGAGGKRELKARWDRNRSMYDPTVLGSLWDVPGIRWHSLCVEASDDPPDPRVHDHRGELCSWDDTANLVAGLDLVITVDTAVAHLAGALGRPLWVLVRPALPVGTADQAPYGQDVRQGAYVEYGDPRWDPVIIGDDGIVRPAVGSLYGERVFHQRALGEWGPVIQDVRAALEQFTAARRAA